MFKYYSVIIIFFISFFNQSCKSSKVQTTTDKTNFDYTLVYESEYGGRDEQESLEINNEAEFSAIWAEVHQNMIPKPELPKIDFSKEKIYIFFFGTYNHGGNLPKIASSTKKEKQLRLHLLSTKKEVDAIAITVMTNPYILISVPKDIEKVEIITP